MDFWYYKLWILLDQIVYKFQIDHQVAHLQIIRKFELVAKSQFLSIAFITFTLFFVETIVTMIWLSCHRFGCRRATDSTAVVCHSLAAVPHLRLQQIRPFCTRFFRRSTDYAPVLEILILCGATDFSAACMPQILLMCHRLFCCAVPQILLLHHNSQSTKRWEDI